MQSSLPLYRRAIDWAGFDEKYPPPDVYAKTIYQFSADRLHSLQNTRFMEAVATGWANTFYRRRWKDAGLSPEDIRSLEDIHKLPLYTTEDIKDDQQLQPPFGSAVGFSSLPEHLRSAPSKLQSSGGTTGKPRLTLHGALEWETNVLSTARALYLQGVRPGDVMQIPTTCSLATLGWSYYAACHLYLGVLPLTTGSGVVTPTRRQLELAFDCGVNCWMSFPEYLLRLARKCQEELGRDIRELNTKMITTFLGPDTEGTLRKEIQDLWGCPVFDNYGTNEIGMGACECEFHSGLHFAEDLHFFEVLDVDTNQPVEDGQTGNLVVTSFHRQIQPVIRFNLRDLARIVSQSTCACGSNFRRMDHFLGRSDSMVRIRGVNIYPMACLPAIKSDARTTGEWVCEVFVGERDGAAREEMIVHVEVRKDAASREGLQSRLEQRLKADLGVAVTVALVDEGALQSVANLGEGKVKRLIDRRPGYTAR